jgi:hypothetical protein
METKSIKSVGLRKFFPKSQMHQDMRTFIQRKQNRLYSSNASDIPTCSSVSGMDKIVLLMAVIRYYL